MGKSKTTGCTEARIEPPEWSREVRVDGELPEWPMAEGSAPLQMQQQENKSGSPLSGVVHTLHSPGPPASSKVSQSLKTGFICLGTADVLIWVLRVGGCFVHQRVFGRTPGLYQQTPILSFFPRAVTPKTSSDTDKCPLRSKIAPN